MRALAAVALVALAACQVDVDGAPCATPGEVTDCPSGQACGNDHACSERAASCERCTPGHSLCAGGAGGAILARACTDADPVCGTWTETDCTALGLVCGWDSGGRAGCACADFDGPVFAADPSAGSPSGIDPPLPFPTGAATPPECRFKSLGDAISRAASLGSAAAVQVHGTGNVEFGTASGDGAAITVPAGVTVAGSPDATATVLRFEPGAGPALVTLEGGIQRVRIEGAGAAAAVATSCGASGVPALTDVAIDGGASSTSGVAVTGACGASLTRVTVENVAGPALSVEADPAAQVTVQGGGLRSSQVGARVTGGKVTIGRDGDAQGDVEIAAHANEGVVLTAGAAVDAQLYGAAIHGNGGTGIAVDRMSLGSALTVKGCDVYANGTTAPRRYGPGAQQRAVGGMLVRQTTLPFTFAGNRLYANAGDQLAFESSGSGWSVASASCGAASNLFGCVADGDFAVAVTAGSVDARNAVWLESPPLTNGSVTTIPYCAPGVVPTPSCP